jgi:predicted amidohydrolase YtcJ
MGSGGIALSMQAIIDAENIPVKYVPELSRAQALDHNIDWVQENYDFYKEHEAELKDKIRFGVSLGTAMRQRDADILGYEDVIELQYGWEGLERMAPLKSLVDNGIPFHIEGTDPRNKPMKIVKDAVTRIDRKGRVVAAHEALTREQAILAITRWAARFMSAEDELGTIEAGKWADLVVFDGDILEDPIETIDQIPTVLTLVGGRVAYEAQ